MENPFKLPSNFILLKIGKYSFYIIVGAGVLLNLGRPVVKPISDAINSHQSKVEARIIAKINQHNDSNKMELKKDIRNLKDSVNKQFVQTKRIIRTHIISTEKNGDKLNQILNMMDDPGITYIPDTISKDSLKKNLYCIKSLSAMKATL